MSVGGWFTWAVVSALFYGVHSFLYQKVIKDGADPLVAQVLQPAVVVILATVMLVSSQQAVADPDVLLLVVVAAVLQGLFFFLTTRSRLAALSAELPASVLFPIIKFSTPVVVVISALAFQEWESIREPRRSVGIALAVGATYLIMQRRRVTASSGSGEGLRLAFVAMVASVCATFAAKVPFAGDANVSIFGFMLVSNLVSLLLATALMARTPASVSRPSLRRGVRWGAAIGALNFAGFAAFLQAVKEGDLALVASISGLYILIPIVLSALWYREHMSPQRQVAVAISVFAVVLLR